MKSQFTVEKHPWLIKYFASRNPVHLLVMILPLVWYLVSISNFGSSTILSTSIFVSLGVLWWTFLEYAIHRWGYHSKYPFKWMHDFFGSFHLYHHIDMSDRRVYNAGFFMVYLIAPVVLFPMWLMTQSLSMTAQFGLGTIGTYYFYEWVHFLLHYKVFDGGYLGWIQQYHFFHHEKRPDKNFGNSNALWDILLGTYDEGYKKYSMSLKAQATMITAKDERIDIEHA
ncbi:MAG: sterol desaturase family protein [Bacteriovoracaceae bacterium]|nr:sterol desaturase family protein [Bacteriovoracaceae bacterium]